VEAFVLGFLESGREDVAESLDVDDRRRKLLGLLKAEMTGDETATKSRSKPLFEERIAGLRTTT
jgi:hypothetical protein